MLTIGRAQRSKKFSSREKFRKKVEREAVGFTRLIRRNPCDPQTGIAGRKKAATRNTETDVFPARAASLKSWRDGIYSRTNIECG